MKYTVKKLDGRYAYNNHFEYCIEFPRGTFGPLEFHRAMMWMIVTYGYSAEVRDFMYIRGMLKKRQQFKVPLLWLVVPRKGTTCFFCWVGQTKCEH